MEVHAHTHTARKNARLTGRPPVPVRTGAGTHYFWEFLMFFPALPCGVQWHSHGFIY
jgi:hypothetical protein